MAHSVPCSLASELLLLGYKIELARLGYFGVASSLCAFSYEVSGLEYFPVLLHKKELPSLSVACPSYNNIELYNPRLSMSLEIAPSGSSRK